MSNDIYYIIYVKFWWLFIVWHHSAFIIIPAYVLIMRKLRVVNIEKYLAIYIVSMWAIYISSLYLTEYLFTPYLNNMIFGLEGGLMGLWGIIEDFIVQLAILMPSYVIISKVFSIKFQSNKWNAIYFISYFLVNHIIYRTYLWVL